MKIIVALALAFTVSCATPRPQDVAPVALVTGGAIVLVGAGLLAPHADAALVAAFGPGEVTPETCWTTTMDTMSGPVSFVDCSDPCDASWSDPALRADCKAMREQHGIEVVR